MLTQWLLYSQLVTTLKMMLAFVASKIAVRLATEQLDPNSLSAVARLDDRSCAASCCQLLPGDAAWGQHQLASATQLLTVRNTYRRSVKCARTRGKQMRSHRAVLRCPCPDG